MGRKAGFIGYIAVILTVCLIPSVGMLSGGESASGGNEVRAQPPVLRAAEGTVNWNYPAQLLDYLGDNYFARAEMVNAWSSLNQKILHSSTAEDVILGRDGWLYYAGTLDNYTGTDPLSDGEIKAMAENLALMAEYCNSQGAKFLFTVAPNKNSLYPEHMPPLPHTSGENGAEKLLAALEGRVPCLNLFSLFKEQEETLYYAWDSHWNNKGAALAADAVNHALERDSAYFSGPFQPTEGHLGDLYAMLYPSGTELENDTSYAGLDFSYNTPFRAPDDLVIDTSSTRDGSLLMFRDSFGNALYPYLADSFGSAYFSRAADYRLFLAGERHAGFVVVELVERNLRYLLQYVPVMPAPVREIPDFAETEFSVPLSAAGSSQLPGYALVTGALPEPGGKAFLDTEEGCFQAFLQESGGFALFIPEAALTEDGIRLIYESDGTFKSADAVM